MRETAAQALGVALSPLCPASVRGVMALLQQLMVQPVWDVRYGGYLGLKYTLASRMDLGMLLLQVCGGGGEIEDESGGGKRGRGSCCMCVCGGGELWDWKCWRRSRSHSLALLQP